MKRKLKQTKSKGSWYWNKAKNIRKTRNIFSNEM